MKKRRKKSEKEKLKKKAWILLSKAIRLEYAVNGYCQCITCGIKKPVIDMQAGHWIAGRGNSILFDERGIRPQCFGCNCLHGGRPLEYMVYMEQEYGVETARLLRDELMRKSHIPYNFTVYELTSRIEDYKQRIKKCEEMKG